MGRKSKLSPSQWEDIGRRLVAGEVPSDLARMYGVHPSQITRRVLAQKSQKVRFVAEQIAQAQTALAGLPIADQHTALSLAEKLRSISDNLASAAEYGAKTAHRLHALANSEVSKIDDAEPMGSIDNLRNVGALTKLANDSAHVALNLIAANKDTVRRLNEDEPVAPSIQPGQLSDATLDDLMRARGSTA